MKKFIGGFAILAGLMSVSSTLGNEEHVEHKRQPASQKTPKEQKYTVPQAVEKKHAEKPEKVDRDFYGDRHDTR